MAFIFVLTVVGFFFKVLFFRIYDLLRPLFHSPERIFMIYLAYFKVDLIGHKKRF